MAGTWQKTKTPGVYVQQNARTGRPRYKAAFRDSRGVVTSKTFPTVKLAEAHLHYMHVRKATGSLPDSSKSRKTVSDLWDHFLKSSRARPSTIAWYESRWENHVKPELGAARVDSMRRADVEGFLTDVEAETSLATRRAVQQLVHKLFAVAVRSEWIIRNPADGIEMPAAQPRLAQFLTEAQVDQIAAEVPPRYQALVYTLAEAGLRIGEASALRVKNLNGNIRVAENSVEVGGKKVIGQPKTAGSERVVPISPKLRAILHEHLNNYGNRFDPESYVFTTEQGAQVRQNNFRKRVFQPAAARASVVPTPTVHQLRHTAASLWLQRGLTPWEVAKMLGHRDTKMIEQRYGHLYVDALQQKIDALSEGS
jgi:integrase